MSLTVSKNVTRLYISAPSEALYNCIQFSKTVSVSVYITGNIILLIILIWRLLSTIETIELLNAKHSEILNKAMFGSLKINERVLLSNIAKPTLYKLEHKDCAGLYKENPHSEED